MSLELSGKPDAWKLARPVWGWGRGVNPRPTPPFDRVFARSDWAVMFILASEGDSYTRLRHNTGPQADVEISVRVDFSREFTGSGFDVWEAEYQHNVVPDHQGITTQSAPIHESPSYLRAHHSQPPSEEEWYEHWFDYLNGHELPTQGYPA